MRSNYFLLTCFLVLSVACKENKPQESTREIITKWIGKTIYFPTDMPCFSMDKEITCPPTSDTPFTIVIYNGNKGCTSCNLRLSDWKEIIAETDSLFPEQVTFQFYYYPQDQEELFTLLKQHQFTHPVHIDIKNQFDKRNKFSSDLNYQSFLLDENNQVICTGNPAKNNRTWNLYKNKIRGTTEENEIKTTITTDNSSLEFGELKIGEEKELEIIIKNTGNNPLIIKKISTSCGCTAVEWDKHPIASGNETTIKIKVTPEHKGFFNKYIDIYTNTEKGVTRHMVKGTII